MVIGKQSITKTPWKLLTFRYTATKLSLLFMLKAYMHASWFPWNDFQIFKCKQTGKK